jgi:hypothetical protein
VFCYSTIARPGREHFLRQTLDTKPRHLKDEPWDIPFDHKHPTSNTWSDRRPDTAARGGHPPTGKKQTTVLARVREKRVGYKTDRSSFLHTEWSMSDSALCKFKRWCCPSYDSVPLVQGSISYTVCYCNNKLLFKIVAQAFTFSPSSTSSHSKPHVRPRESSLHIPDSVNIYDMTLRYPQTSRAVTTTLLLSRLNTWIFSTFPLLVHVYGCPDHSSVTLAQPFLNMLIHLYTLCCSCWLWDT